MSDRPTQIVVTGAGGWLGRNLVERSRPTARRVRCLVQTARRRGRSLGARRAVRCRRSSATCAHPAALDRAVRRRRRPARTVVSTPPAVIHPSDAVRELRRRQRRRHVSSCSTGPAAAGVRRLVHVSSNSPVRREPATDATCSARTSPYHPYLGYGALEAGGRASSCSRSHERGDVDAVIVRPPWFYGPHQPARQTQLLRGRCAGPVPGPRRRPPAAVDGLHRQPRRTGCSRAEVADAPPGRAYWIADARAVRDASRSSRRCATRSPPRARRSSGGQLRAARASPASSPSALDRVLQRPGPLRAGRSTCSASSKDTIACDISGATRRARLRPADRAARGHARAASAGASSAGTTL